VLAWVGDSAALHVDMHANLDQACQPCTSKARSLLPRRVFGGQDSPGPEFGAAKVDALGLDLGLEGLTLTLPLSPCPNSYPHQPQPLHRRSPSPHRCTTRFDPLPFKPAAH
jgi:hypothetical protein